MIVLRDVVREYRGPLGGVFSHPVRALDGVTLQVPAGTALGIVGPNGAGKSTLIRLLLGYLRPTRGEVTVAGLSPRAYAERHGVGYVPERIAIPTRWTVRGAMRAYAALGEVEDAAERIETQIRQFGLEPLAERRVGALSKGNLQRLGLAQALLGDRKLLILDEPTDGLDPEWTARLREILTEWRRKDPERVVLFASHNLDEVERAADQVVILGEGRLRERIDLRETLFSLPRYRLDLEGAAEAAEALVHELFPDAVRVEGSTPVFQIHAPDLPELNRRLAHLLERGGVIRALVPEAETLEQRFRRSFTRTDGKTE